ncbi:hypothetical protein [Stenotrophomonas cyclobalanopsidis]|uniref:hypothetical protein n=1 Tax=Stenotrophomonas cyclobalanopsidis TaxID=2771362 RepID=UPI002FDA7A7B
MSAVILPFPRRMIRAVAVAEGVRRCATRLGYKPHLADQAASLARADFLRGDSAAMAIGRMVRDLRAGMDGGAK